jgi:hypothetical protein
MYVFISLDVDQDIGTCDDIKFLDQHLSLDFSSIVLVIFNDFFFIRTNNS